ncbi:uncharacterized protein LOC133888858 [Phragmites australis]|uniref:uncharacterized protein LOC133888858 n=1 Tax=Phragmites australis TaxID=29695 RepID=UPI002D797DC0|nr:uncharacterized protein LOC133888858 [Phragmites australis]
MGYSESASPASAATARDAKKRRGNRTAAKLKQSKLETRRGQWLSHAQGKDVKEAKVASSPTGAGSNAGSPILASPHPPLPRRRADTRSRGSDAEDREETGAAGLEVGGTDLDSPMHSPGSNNSQGVGCPLRKGCSGDAGGPSLSSGSSVWSSSRSVSDAEEDDTGCPEDESEVLDDWEAVADALSVDDSHCHQSSGPMMPPAAPTNATPVNEARPEPTQSKTRAWAPDDIFRPQSLPSISKQASFPASIGNCWVGMGMGMGAAQQSILSLPLSCPICYEDLDPTDSSFLPCPCGFHLCLFCHKRILEADGRCPGCRKQYNTVSAAEGGGGGGAKATTVGIGREMANVAPVRLSRSCSMGPRY